MAPLTSVVDSSVLTRLGVSAVRSVVEPLANEGRLLRPRICDLEIGSSARNRDESDRLVEALDVFTVVKTTSAQLRRAAGQRLLAERSQRGRKIPDLLVAAAAEELDLTVLHYDPDFDRIAEVTGQSCRWVVPAGSVS